MKETSATIVEKEMIILLLSFIVQLIYAQYQRREYLPTKSDNCYKTCGKTGKCTSHCGPGGYCCNQDRFAFPYCKREMADSIKFLSPEKKHHVCVASFSCDDVLSRYKTKVNDLNIQNAFYKRLGWDGRVNNCTGISYNI